MVTTRGKAEREGGGGAVGQKRVGGDPCSYRRGQTAPGAPPAEAAQPRWGPDKVSQAPAPALIQPQPWNKRSRGTDCH